MLLQSSLLPGMGVWVAISSVKGLPFGLHDRLDTDRLRHVLLHELAHVKRNDVLFNWMAAIAQLVHWFNPIVWLATRLMRSDMELACDASVLGHLAGGERREYGEMLVHMADSCGGQTAVPYALGVADRLSDLRGRLTMIARFRIASIRNKCATVLAIAAVTSIALIQPGFTSPVSAQAHAAASTRSAPAEQSQAQLLLKQTRPQKEVPFNPADFDKFAGYYQRQPGLPVFFHIYRTGNRYYSQITGQMPVEIFPESPSEFFATVVAAQVSFDIGPNGQVTGLVLHQGGLLMPWRRVSAAAFAAANAKLQQRIKNNVPSPGTEAALRHQIETLEHGAPDYAAMGPGLAEATRQQLPKIKALFKNLGAFKSLRFSKVLPNGADFYLATFEHGELQCTITPLSPDGKVTGDFFHWMP